MAPDRTARAIARPGRVGIALSLMALGSTSPAVADDWSSLGVGIFLGYVLIASFALQLLACAVLALRRGLQRGWKSGLAYFGGALLVPPVAALLLMLLARSPMSSGIANPAIALAFMLAPHLLAWLAFFLIVREHDRQPENIIWKQTR